MRPPASVHDPKRASISVSARSYDRITLVAGQLGLLRSKLIGSRINTFLNEQDSLINVETRMESWGKHPNAEVDLIDEVDYVRLRVREPSGKASIFLTREDLHWLIERARHLERKLP